MQRELGNDFAPAAEPELCRRRLGMGWRTLLLIVGGVGAVLGIIIAMGVRQLTGGPTPLDIVLGVVVAGCSIALIVLAFWLRATAIFGNTGVIVERRFKPPVFLPYDLVESVAAYRIRMRHNGAYLGTSMNLDLQFAPEAALRRVRTQSTHKEPKLRGVRFSLTQHFETVPQPEDTIAELAATYVAPKLMKRIENGEAVRIGPRLTIDRTAIHLRLLFSKRSIEWNQCVGIDLAGDMWQMQLIDGTKVGLPANMQMPNFAALVLLAPVLCAGRTDADVTAG